MFGVVGSDPYGGGEWRFVVAVLELEAIDERERERVLLSCVRLMERKREERNEGWDLYFNERERERDLFEEMFLVCFMEWRVLKVLCIGRETEKESHNFYSSYYFQGLNMF